MVRILGIMALIYMVAVAQTSLVPEELAGMGRPYVPAMLLVFIAACCEASPAILLSGLLGLVLDGLSTERLGMQLGLAALMGFGLQIVQPMWRSRSLLALVAMIMVTCVAWRSLAPMAQGMLSNRVINPHAILTSAVQDAAWSALIAGVLILLGRGLASHGTRSRVAVGSANPRWGTVVR